MIREWLASILRSEARTVRTAAPPVVDEVLPSRVEPVTTAVVPAPAFALVQEIDPPWPPIRPGDDAYNGPFDPPEEIDEEAADAEIYSASLRRNLTTEERIELDRRKAGR